MTVILIGLGNAEAAGRPILRLLDVLLSAETRPDMKKTILEKDFDIPMTAAISREAKRKTCLIQYLGKSMVRPIFFTV